ncbi:MAG: hypothetical protein EXR54_08570 [Dehalococcoidia bacterium]|nr:hypothetical protein [Dehalococcoidia bacterium]MSQ17593.1 hypothetical protein [Dehalococcoidia bacterium]
MFNPVYQLLKRVRPLWRDQQGITGLETAIVLIAFVVVSSVFAFAALSTGLFTTDRAKETIHAGLTQARSTLEMRGSLLAVATAGTTGTVTQLRFQVANAGIWDGGTRARAYRLGRRSGNLRLEEHHGPQHQGKGQRQHAHPGEPCT